MIKFKPNGNVPVPTAKAAPAVDDNVDIEAEASVTTKSKSGFKKSGKATRKPDADQKLL